MGLPLLQDYLWFIVMLIGAAMVLQALRVIGAALDHRCRLHDLRVQVVQLRRQQVQKIQALRMSAERGVSRPRRAAPAPEAERLAEDVPIETAQPQQSEPIGTVQPQASPASAAQPQPAVAA